MNALALAYRRLRRARRADIRADLVAFDPLQVMISTALAGPAER
jgi:hypothetical protein